LNLSERHLVSWWGFSMSDRTASGQERRRHPRVEVDGGTELLVNGRAWSARLRDASRVGARVEINSDDFKVGPDEEVVLKGPSPQSHLEIVCKVRHFRVTKNDETGQSSLSIGLESVSLDDSRDDLLGILLASGTARVVLGEGQGNAALPAELENKVVALLREGVRSSATSRILGPGKPVPTVAEFDIKANSFSEEEWAVAITIHSRPMTIIFKTYYHADAAKEFLRVKKAKPDAEFEDRLIHDFMREFCNLTAGAIKIWVAEHSGEHFTGKDLLVNLPFATPASYETGHHPGKSHNLTHIYDSWDFTVEGGARIMCSSEIEIRNWKDVSEIATVEKKEETGEAAADEDDIEFL